ncbi:heterokaryon incompatibility protein [Metarhizium robertsii]|uniref:Heterokaryon incompatibility protein Het-C n=2 Tax=Metarhizium robertsii TaxID=568076 RepID=E9F5A7_METRA|nr:heterokaryon incompatibility protein Het-C [Metarhizium robertsii ARSEF 23]EFY97160.1 heterokaryon incompatibility protein Het-C [Metarhizium robertsii ARSEF 23]EXV00533.1 heterokaryon incompatibility protein [Metarhizium robertsii]
MIDLRNHGLLLGLIVLVALATPAAAFGAGNIASTSKVEGQNWRHGDIEDALLTLAMARAMKHKKFNKIMVSRVYFGNWLRDYSQAIDVGTVKSVSAEAIRLLLCVLGFLTFGYGSGEFEVTADRLGCYRPEDHIDNPKNYADNQDARQYDSRLRGPIDESRELSIDPESGMKNYIANERADIMTSAKHVRNLFGRCIELGRNYKNGGRKEDLYESLRLLGTGLHCLEDFLAHSNYCELALIEMGERDIFPHVGRDTLIRLEGANGDVYPIVTGTFGGVDFLHSVVGEVSDKMTQNEIEELEGTLQDSKNSDTSLLRQLLDKIPEGLLGGKDQKSRIDQIQENASASQVENMSVSPRNPEEFTAYVQQVYKQIMPAIEFHDDIMKGITSAVEKIPVLPKIIEQLEEQLSRFVFSIMAPVVVPLIRQIKSELATGSGEVIKSSENEQHVVFNDDRSTDPTHSMLSKDHFSNILNEIAGRTAAKMISWAVPQIMDAIDDDSTDVNRLCDRVINGILHHPAQRDMGRDGVSEARNTMFKEVTSWWQELRSEQDSYRQKLSRDGVMRGENHKEGVDDTGHGHGCAGKLKMRKLYGEPDTLENKIAGAAADAIVSGATGLVAGIVEQNTGYKLPAGQSSQHNQQEEEKGGLEGFLSKAGSILGGAFGKDEDESKDSGRNDNDSFYSQSQSSYGRQDSSYGQSQQSSGYGHSQQSSSYGQSQQSSSYGHSQQSGRHDDNNRRRRDDDESGGYSGRQESSYGGSSGYGRQESSYGSSTHHGRRDDDNYGRQESSYGGREDSYGGSGGYGGGRQESGHGGRQESYGGNSSYGRQESSYGREDGGYGRQESGYGGDGGYGRQESGSGGNSSHGRRHEDSYGRRDDDDDNEGYGRREHHGRRRDNEYGY